MMETVYKSGRVYTRQPDGSLVEANSHEVGQRLAAERDEARRALVAAKGAEYVDLLDARL